MSRPLVVPVHNWLGFYWLPSQRHLSSQIGEHFMTSDIVFRERLWPGLGIPTFLMFMGLSLAIAYQRVYHGNVGLITFFMSALVTVIVTIRLAPVVEISTENLRVGTATIARQHLGKVAVLDHRETSLALGQVAHRSALTVTRSGIASSVLVEILDQNDPHPYWLFSSRKAGVVSTLLKA
jgi:hypothetical protein